MINIYEQLNDKGYLLLDGDEIEIESLEKLKKTFEGYPKTLSTIMLAYFELPMQPKLILFDPNLASVKEVMADFSTSAKEFFIRSDTKFNKIDNLNFRGAHSDSFVEDILKIKEYPERWVLSLAVPTDPGQEFRNTGNCRMGRINGIVTQEWTGEGFAEYHLGKDKFPQKAALHAVIQLDQDGSYKKIYQVSKKQYLEDCSTLLRAYGIESLKLKRKFIDHDYYKKLTGKNYLGKEPTNEELENAFVIWAEKENVSEEKLIKLGIEHVSASGKQPKSLKDYLAKKGPWKPAKTQIDYLFERFTVFEEKCHKLGITSEGKILTCSFNKSNKNYNKYGGDFWDIFNLFV